MSELALSRRRLLRAAALGGFGMAVAGIAGCGAGTPGGGSGAEGTLNLADLGVGDPGDWSKFKAESNWGVNLVAVGNAPAQVVNVLMGGGRQKYELINVVGGMQRPLVQNQLISPMDMSRIPSWGQNRYIENFLAEGKAGFSFISDQGKVYGFPTILQGDSFAYLPDETGPLDSYGALFDPKFRGFSALEDNFTTTGQKTALYLKASGQATINDPSDMTPSEIKTVVDFLIEKKKDGQFRTIYSSFNDAVALLTRKEVKVMDAWEPMVIAAKAEGVNVEYANPKEGYLLWSYVSYLVNKPDLTEAQDKARYDLVNFMGGPWYGAKITLLRGYMTNPQAIDYAAAHPEEFKPEDVEQIRQIHAGVEKKFQQGGTWQNRWPTNVKDYETEWARFSAA